MTVQEQAFRAYYASLADAELLQIAANRRSYISVAQEALARQRKLRNLDLEQGAAAPNEGAGGR